MTPQRSRNCPRLAHRTMTGSRRIIPHNGFRRSRHVIWPDMTVKYHSAAPDVRLTGR